MLPPDASELDVSIGTPPARDVDAKTAQAGAADEGMAEDSLQGTDLLSMMEEAGEEELELETELELEAQQLQQPPQQQQTTKQRKRKKKSKRTLRENANMEAQAARGEKG
jgi:hypothetical protein